MFQAVRQWWSGGRGKVTARLFLFEFAVVVVGVLTAQGLASWVADRAEQRSVGEEDKRVRYEIGRTRQVARLWSAATPCLMSESRLSLAEPPRASRLPSMNYGRPASSATQSSPFRRT